MNDERGAVRTEVSDEQLSWRLMSRAALGRLAFIDAAGPTIVPVNCAVLDHTVVFRTGDDTAVATLAPGSRVAFEVDDTDRDAEEGWSVLVRGELWPVTDRDGLARLEQLTVRPWVEGPKDRWMRIVPATVTGRITTRRRATPLVPGPGAHSPA